MRRNAIIFVLCSILPRLALAGTHTLDYNGTLVHCAEHDTTNATLEGLRTTDNGSGWASGDTVTLSDSSGLVWPSGGLNLSAVSSAGNPPTWLIVYLNGQTLSYATTGASTSSVIAISKSYNAFIGPGYLKDTGTSGRVIGVGNTVTTMTADIAAFVISDITVLQCPVNESWGPIAIDQKLATDYSVSGILHKVRFNLGGGYRDIIGTSGNCTTKRGSLWFVDCEASGSTCLGNQNNGTTNNPLSCDAAAEHYVYGGVYHDGGGDVIQQATQASGPRVYVWGAKIYNSGVNTAYETVFNTGTLVNLSGATYTLQNTASTNTNSYVTYTNIRFTTGNASGQAAKACTAYNTGTKVYTVAAAFAPAPAIGDTYEIRGVGLSTASAGIRAHAVYDCDIRECGTGIILEGHNYTDGMCEAVGNRLTAPISAARSNNSLFGTVAGVVCNSPHCNVDGNVIEGWDWGSTVTSNKYGACIYPLTNFTGGTARIANNWFKRCVRGVDFQGLTDVATLMESNIIECGPATWHTSSVPAGIWATGASSTRTNLIRLVNNVFVHTPQASSGGYCVVTGTGSVQDPLGGHNYYWANGNQSGILSTYTANVSDNATSFRTGAANQPLIDSRGRIVPGNPAAAFGQQDNLQGAYQYFTSSGLISTTQFTTATLSQQLTDSYIGQSFMVLNGTSAGATPKITACSYSGGTWTITYSPATTAGLSGSTQLAMLLPPLPPALETGAAAGISTTSLNTASLTQTVCNAYVGSTILFTSGTYKGLAREITGTVYRTAPTVTTLTYGTSLPAAVGGTPVTGTATAGAGNTTSTIILTGTSATDSFYVGWIIQLTGGTASGGVGVCTAYVGATKVATITGTWGTGTPDGTTTYSLASTDTFIVIPPCKLPAFNLNNLKMSSLKFGANRWTNNSDMLGRFRPPSVYTGVLGGLMAGRMAPGPFSYTPPKNDFRRKAPDRGFLPGSVDALFDFRD